MLKIKLHKWGNSYGFRLPKQIMQMLGIKPEQEFSVHTKDSHIVLTKIDKNEHKENKNETTSKCFY